MLDTFRAELLKLRVRRAVHLMLIALAAISAAVPVLQSLFGGGEGFRVPPDLLGAWEMQNFGAFLFAGLGAVLVGGEFRSRVMTTELVRGQTRLQLIGAKLVAFCVLGAAGAIVIGLSIIVGALIATLVGDVTYAEPWFSQASGDWALGLVRAALALAAGAIFGGACGMIARSTGAAVGIAFAYFAFIEPAGVALIDLVWHVQDPPSLFFSIDALRGEAWGPDGELSLTADGAAFSLAAWCAVLSALQAGLFVRRDIT